MASLPPSPLHCLTAGDEDEDELIDIFAGWADIDDSSSDNDEHKSAAVPDLLVGWASSPTARGRHPAVPPSFPRTPCKGVPTLASSTLQRWGALLTDHKQRRAFAIFQAKFNTRTHMAALRESLRKDLTSPSASAVLGMRPYFQRLQTVRDPLSVGQHSEVDAVVGLMRFVRRLFPADRELMQVVLLHNFGKLLSLGSKAWPPALLFGESRVVMPDLAEWDLLTTVGEAAHHWMAGRHDDPPTGGLLSTIPLTLNHAAAAAEHLVGPLGARGGRRLRMLRYSTLGSFVQECGPSFGTGMMRFASPWLAPYEDEMDAYMRRYDFAFHWFLRGLRAFANNLPAATQYLPQSAAEREAAIRQELAPVWRSVFGGAPGAGPRVRLDPRDIPPPSSEAAQSRPAAAKGGAAAAAAAPPPVPSPPPVASPATQRGSPIAVDCSPVCEVACMSST